MSKILSIIALAATAAALSGCASDGPAQSYGWSYQQVEGEGEKLAYGAPNSDDVVLMMTCAPGSGRVALSALTVEARGDIVLASGADQDRFAGAAYESELGGMIVEAQARAKAPTLAHFAKSGDLTLMTSGQKVSLKADGTQRDSVTRFFANCA